MDIQIIHLKNVPIFEQLLLEERLLREDTGNFCIINSGSSKAIVMGISGKVDELVSREKAKALSLPLIKRYSGGGTVVVDEDTLFVSFICNRSVLPCEAYPEKIMRWSAHIYEEALNIPSFALKENDFVLGEYKFGGNAQYITKNRFVQHTSFLWDFQTEHMQTLLHPKKTPKYREEREHTAFLCKLKDHLETKEAFFESLLAYLKVKYNAKERSPPCQKGESRISTKILSI